jgi:hypothetical protein
MQMRLWDFLRGFGGGVRGGLGEGGEGRGTYQSDFWHATLQYGRSLQREQNFVAVEVHTEHRCLEAIEREARGSRASKGGAGVGSAGGQRCRKGLKGRAGVGWGL